MPVKRRDRDTDEPTDETLVLFKIVAVFAQDQVAPLPDVEPAPIGPPSRPLTGDSHSYLIAPTIAFAEGLGYTGPSRRSAAPPAAGATPRITSETTGAPRLDRVGAGGRA
jgi:hypothetical protein